ncbi:MAG: hypothetical protein M3P18_26790 [Actinomycetota bacterium]|nr:hypothetical protein [Actinomycetota bacterium]
MALAEQQRGRFAPILEDLARNISRLELKRGSAEGAPATLRIGIENNVKRIVQVYWTAFEANIPDDCIAMHLEVAEPRVHWAEGYLSPKYRNWVFCFRERADGEIELAQYGDYATPEEAITYFFNFAEWNVLMPTAQSWNTVTYDIADNLSWGVEYSTVAEASLDAAVQESLKKSTIIWLRWRADGIVRQMPVWFVLDQGKIYVLSGERQQTIPNARELRKCEVIVRWKGRNARVAELPASVQVVEPGPEWMRIGEKIAEKRLNIPGLPEETARRWRDECEILELTLPS